ncbi:MAG: hypothetical protein M1820_004848 [Bogoriella megaspora]|nr:MAG: hypothetical protein M1820_004848 [Bogoriella megaspora]
MVSWGVVKSLAITLGPFLLPKIIAFIRSIRASSNPAAIRPCPKSTNWALNILFLTALTALISTLPTFSPQNIFAATQSRLQIPNDVLFTRLATLNGFLTTSDEQLKSKFVNLESRLLYFKYGPDVLARCVFCTSKDESSYTVYSLPSLLTPHIAHLIALGFTTSRLFFGRPAGRWRTEAALLGGGLALAELWLTFAFDHRSNSKATRVEEIDAFYWRMRLVRGAGIAACDALLGWIMWLTATNRWLVKPAPVEERLETSLKGLEAVQGKLGALGAVRNTVYRNSRLRGVLERYWTEEGRVMAEVHEEKDVVDGINGVLQKVDLEMIQRQARQMAEGVLGPEGSINAKGPGIGKVPNGGTS